MNDKNVVSIYVYIQLIRTFNSTKILSQARMQFIESFNELHYSSLTRYKENCYVLDHESLIQHSPKKLTLYSY